MVVVETGAVIEKVSLGRETAAVEKVESLGAGVMAVMMAVVETVVDLAAVAVEVEREVEEWAVEEMEVVERDVD